MSLCFTRGKKKNVLTWLGMINETFLSALQTDLSSWREKRTKQVFGQIYLPMRTHFHKPCNCQGEKPTKSQHEAQFLPALITREVEQKMDHGVL